MIIAKNNHEALLNFKACLRNSFKTKDLGIMKYFLGLEVARGPRGIFMSQLEYALNIISETAGVNPADFPPGTRSSDGHG